MGICFSGAPSLHSSSLNRPHYSGASDIHGNIVDISETTTTEIRKYRFSVREDIYSDRSPLPFTDSQILKWPELKVFSFEELKSATGNFKSDRLVGEGGFGRVYKGWLDENTLTPAKPSSGVEVAIKMFKPGGTQGFTQWQSEVNVLGRLSHPNVIRLLGYCWDEDQFLLVYEFMPNGSLEWHLFKRNHGMEPLSWNTRLKIVIGAARGLAFLHTNENNVIFRDFKTSNILLDGNYNAKLADFGLAKLGPSEGQSHATTAVMGTDGYAAPEYMTTDFGLAKLEPFEGQSHVTTSVMGTYGYAAPEYVATGHLYVKSDVYGFGVVLLEILTGMRALDTRRLTGKQNLVEWTKPYLSSKKKLKRIMDDKIEGQYSPKAALELAQLALKCLEHDPKQRPSMKEVLEGLEAIENMH
ncbi:probable serine/threonine-protein kinase PIX13 [Vigna radiata var. radiata]|uniref:non-specific serine/threonine protein kinase n=1 Tax=Vigna radiata var. radiata TaxID=3916 RepID=A0A1S3ULR9_VIGRR|nr:probable serine/threonine-protein kinase PIX13 [Vigna radiata var. radiata]